MKRWRKIFGQLIWPDKIRRHENIDTISGNSCLLIKYFIKKKRTIINSKGKKTKYEKKERKMNKWRRQREGNVFV